MKALVAGWKDLSTVDIIGEPCFSVWFCGCNFRCPWCQNWHIVECRDCREVDVSYIAEKALESKLLVYFLHVTGGEPTLQYEALSELYRRVKEGGMKTSLDTNGALPEVVKKLVPVLDHLALDIKAPFSNLRKYAEAIGLPENLVERNRIVDRVRESLEIGLKYLNKIEVRFPVVPRIHSEDDVVEAFHEVAEVVESTGSWNRAVFVLQQYIPSENIPSTIFRSEPMTDPELLKKIAHRVLKEISKLDKVYIRTIEHVEKIEKF